MRLLTVWIVLWLMLLSATIGVAQPYFGHVPVGRTEVSRLDVAGLHRLLGSHPFTQADLDGLLLWAANSSRGRENFTDWCQIVDLLVSKGASLNSPQAFRTLPLTAAAQDWHAPYVAYLLEKGARPNPERVAPYRATPLCAAVGSQTADHWIGRVVDRPLGTERLRWRSTVLALLEGGADPMARGRGGIIPFQRVCYWGETYLVAHMLAHGADPNVRGLGKGRWPDTGSYTALHCAALRDSEANAVTVRLLLAFGADPQAKDDFGRTPLDIALYKRHIRVAAALGFTDWPPLRPRYVPAANP